MCRNRCNGRPCESFYCMATSTTYPSFARKDFAYSTVRFRRTSMIGINYRTIHAALSSTPRTISCLWQISPNHWVRRTSTALFCIAAAPWISSTSLWGPRMRMARGLFYAESICDTSFLEGSAYLKCGSIWSYCRLLRIPRKKCTRVVLPRGAVSKPMKQ